ncbi:urate hydroxylase PuuD [Candidatus Nitrosacidococcus sp. I8]|uniref:urate hydroxylase PuuD n=1 Tax=Candidatus Nitrosacidococcus sp. I8 TaxID=2942908 RepID=UPI0022260D2B|nr:urate hydroxylase PuuD [Candidatus Nitrosacidococcus sp. I8]CAH9018171.1 hypothetical protein NURINAE_00772 [Candidatus Nitrosacidococcus sp. I8]
MDSILVLDRWLHFLAGITWIGLLYYFNLVQTQAVAAANNDSQGPGPAAISKYVAPRALFFFRWSALVTWLSGLIYLETAPQYSIHGAFTLGVGAHNLALTTIGMGAWLGTIMLFNVWVLIWPNQKKLLGFVEATPEKKKKAARVAFLASRTNTMLSLPMLLFMGGASHGLLF